MKVLCLPLSATTCRKEEAVTTVQAAATLSRTTSSEQACEGDGLEKHKKDFNFVTKMICMCRWLQLQHYKASLSGDSLFLRWLFKPRCLVSPICPHLLEELA